MSRKQRIAEIDDAIDSLSEEIMGVPDELIGTKYDDALLITLSFLMGIKRII